MPAFRTDYMKIAVCGKGGVGKTFIAGCLAWLCMQNGHRTLAIDADSSPNLGVMLGLGVKEAGDIIPISENQELIESRTGTGYPGVYRLSFPVDDLISRYSFDTPSGVPLLVMGTIRSLGSGCMCQANALVRTLLHHIMLEKGDCVIMDMEAGVEHLGRGTARHVDLMMVVTDADTRSLAVAERICTVAKEYGIPRIVLTGNRVRGQRQEGIIAGFARTMGFPLLGCVPYDARVQEAGVEGDIPMHHADTPAIRAIDILRQRIEKMT
jgi:CO dehydrogenase maturation factor